MDLPVKNIVSQIDLKPADALLPLFECIINSVNSLKLTTDIPPTKKKIIVEIERDGYPHTLMAKHKTIKLTRVIDNGEGFTDANLISFQTAYSRKNKGLGCKGIGRFTMLAAFQKIKIQSIYIEKRISKIRELQFDGEKEVQVSKEEEIAQTPRKTVVELLNLYNSTIQNATAISLEEIPEEIMNHCLIFYLCKELPVIEISDVETGEVLSLDKLYKAVSKEREKEFMIGATPIF